MPVHRVLVVEDEESLANVLKYRLAAEGFDVCVVHSGPEALDAAHRYAPDAIVLDWMLPGLDGAEVCRRLKSSPETARIPILMLTARTSEADEVMALSIGADDYVAKPFRMLPLVQRIKRLVGRQARVTADTGPEDEIRVHGILLDRRRGDAITPNGPAGLTATEFRILWILAKRPGETFTRNELLDGAVGTVCATSPRTIDAHVKSVRRKLGPFGQLIETVWGQGYRLRSEPAENPHPANP